MRAHGGKAVVEAEREKSAHLFKRAGLDHSVESRLDRRIKRLALRRDDKLQHGVV